MIELEYLVTGTGRCGTVYMARLLSSLGIMCAHEAFFDEQGIEAAQRRLRSGEFDSSYVSRHDFLTSTPQPDWFDRRQVRAESSYMAAPFLRHALLHQAAVVHVVRHPLQVISSFVHDIHFFDEGAHLVEKYRRFVIAHLPQVTRAKGEIERSCRYWIEWNEMIERSAAGKRYFRMRVDAGLPDELLHFLRVPKSMVDGAFANSRINSWNRRAGDLSLDDIPAGETKSRLIDLAASYGFEAL